MAVQLVTLWTYSPSIKNCAARQAHPPRPVLAAMPWKRACPSSRVWDLTSVPRGSYRNVANRTAEKPPMRPMLLMAGRNPYRAHFTMGG